MINKLTKNGTTLYATISLELDARPFHSLMHARDFLTRNKSKIENLINKYAFAKCSLSIKELSIGEKPAIVNSLKRLGLIENETR